MSATPKDGIPRRAIVRVPVITVSGDTMVQMFEFLGGSALEAMTNLPGFPSPIYPTGSSTPRWVVPLKSLCSWTCAMPHCSSRSSALPTRTQTFSATTGAEWSSTRMTSRPLASV